MLRDVEAALEKVMGREHDPEREEHRRVARLLSGDSELRALAAAQERGLATRLRERLNDRLEGLDPTTVLLVVEVAVAVWSACWERWGELAAQGREEDPVELYRRCRSELRRIVG